MSFDVKEITNDSIRLDTNNIINIKRIYIFDSTSYIISESYNLYVCGYNYYGEAGVGYSGQINTWTKIDIEGINNNVKEVISNSYSSYLITLDNNLYVCGDNYIGQLGVGNTTDILTWTEINIEGINNNVKEVIANDNSSYLTTLDNNLYVCGYNSDGGLGVGNTTDVLTWTKSDIEDIEDTVEIVKEVINNSVSSYLITNDNNLYVCGNNGSGELGLGNNTNIIIWTKIDIEGINNNVKEVINNQGSSYLTTLDNNLYVCGRNNYGQLGVGDTTNVLTWTKIDIEGINNNVKEVINNNYSSYLITNDNNLYVCGYNNQGQLGIDNNTNILTWTKIDIEGINNNVKEVIINNSYSSYLITNNNNLYVCGYNNGNGQLGVGYTTNILTWTKIDIEGINNNVKEVIINNNSSYLITNDNNLYVCGRNNFGQLGVGNTFDVKIWAKINIEDINNNVKEVISNNNSSYLITLDNNLYVCGRNNYGQLGVGYTTNVKIWAKINIVGINNNVKEVINDNGSSYLITLDNNLYVCGKNTQGQLGVGDTTDVLTWTKITTVGIINNVKEIIINNYSSYLITLDNNLYICGYNGNGQLGVGNTTDIYTWTKIEVDGIVDNVKEVIYNNGSSYLITLDNNLYVCGGNNYGQLGVGDTTNRNTWTKTNKIVINNVVTKDNNVKEVINNNYSSYLITLDNNLYVCGRNYFGQLGVGNTTNVLTWTKITLTGIVDNVKEVITSNGSSYLITNDNNLYVCGRNNYGQLGVGNTTNVLTWTKIDIEGITDNVASLLNIDISVFALITINKRIFYSGTDMYMRTGMYSYSNTMYTWTEDKAYSKFLFNDIVLQNELKNFIINNINFSDMLIYNNMKFLKIGYNLYSINDDGSYTELNNVFNNSMNTFVINNDNLLMYNENSLSGLYSFNFNERVSNNNTETVNNVGRHFPSSIQSMDGVLFITE